MKVKVLKNNNRVIATGSMYGRPIKAIAVCNEPVFDEEIGIALAKRKYKIKEQQAKRDYHKRTITWMRGLIKWCESQIAMEQGLVDEHNTKISNMEADYNEFVHSLFRG